MARPSKYNPAVHVQLVKWWARDGLTHTEIAQRLEIAESTFHKWLLDFPELSESLKEGKENVDFQVEDKLLKRAFGYDIPVIETEVGTGSKGPIDVIRRTTKHIPPDVTACIFWLKNRKPKQWRDKVPEEAENQALILQELIESMKKAANAATSIQPETRPSIAGSQPALESPDRGDS